MLTFLKGWAGPPAIDTDRILSSLALFSPGRASGVREGAAFLAMLPRGSAGNRPRQPWRPSRSPAGNPVLFHGWLDNAPEIASELGLDAGDAARLYGAAVERWGDDADLRLHGQYCAVMDRRDKGDVRLARSPIVAPPLHYHRSPHGWFAAASVPRVIHACGVPAQIDEDYLARHLNLSPPAGEGGWYRGISRVPIGSIVHVTPDGEHTRSYYDLQAIPPQDLKRDEDYLERTRELLTEAVRRTVAPFAAPGVALSGGLDSPLLAVTLLDQLPAGRDLPCFTFHPEDGWDGKVYKSQYGDERDKVRDLAAAWPRLKPHFTDSAGKGFDDRLHAMFLAMGAAPAALPLVFMDHDMRAAAARAGCDVLLGADFGNLTFSNTGQRGLVEYFRKGRWIQLWRALADQPFDHRPLWRRFLSLSLLRALPDPLWHAAMRLRHGRGPADFSIDAGALNPAWPGAAEIRAQAASDPSFTRPFFRNAVEERAFLAAHGDLDGGDIWQGLEQVHGLPSRDVAVYRPLFEFCLGLPTDQFLRDGMPRWLARRLGEGRLPPSILAERRYGFHQADWHLRIGRVRHELLREIARLETRPDMARLIDLPRLRAALEDFPEETSTDPAIWEPLMMGVPRGLTAARFMDFASGRNAP